MIDLNVAARRVLNNRIKRGFPSAYDLSKTVNGYEEEIQEFKKALDENDEAAILDAALDLMAYSLGVFAMKNRDIEAELLAVLDNNEKREYRRHH